MLHNVRYDFFYVRDSPLDPLFTFPPLADHKERKLIPDFLYRKVNAETETNSKVLLLYLIETDIGCVKLA